MTSVISVGVFDGLHLGHQQILARARARARAHAARCIVVSFEPHPDVVLARSFNPSLPLTPHAEKRERLLAMGLDAYEVIPFTRELAKLEPEEFVDRHLIEPFGMVALVVGANFALGRARSGNVPRLTAIGAERGFEVEPVPLFEQDGGPVSSTRIRELLTAGRVHEASKLLGRRYGLGGLVVTGERIGRTLGCPTANLRLHDEKFLPGDGVYAAWAQIAGESAWHPAAMSIGMRPTFGEHGARAIEAHLLDWSGDLVGRELRVEFEDWVRGQVAFANQAELAAAIPDDLRAIRARLTATSAPA